LQLSCFAYVANFDSDEVSVIDVASNTVMATVAAIAPGPIAIR